MERPVGDGLNGGGGVQFAFERVRVDDRHVGNAVRDQILRFAPDLRHAIVGREDLNPEQRGRGGVAAFEALRRIDAHVRDGEPARANFDTELGVRADAPLLPMLVEVCAEGDLEGMSASLLPSSAPSPRRPDIRDPGSMTC